MTTRRAAFRLAAALLAVGLPAADLVGQTQSVAAPLAAGTARGTASAGKAQVSYTNAYAVLIASSNTLIIGCLDTAIWPAEVEKVAAYARRETTGVFKYGLNTVSTAILELTMPFKAGATAATVAGLEGFDVTMSNEPLDWTSRFATDPKLLEMNASFSGNTARLVELAGALKTGARVRGRLVGKGRDPRGTPPTPLAWDVAFDAVVTVAR